VGGVLVSTLRICAFLCAVAEPIKSVNSGPTLDRYTLVEKERASEIDSCWSVG
jgi:hypothetical protein